MRRENKMFREIKPMDKMTELFIYSDKLEIQGLSVGFSKIDKIWEFRKGGVTDITGYPTSGKTQFLMEILLNTAIQHGKKHILYLPDAGTPLEILADLVHKYTGKTFNKKYPNLITRREIEEATLWLSDHFLIIDNAELDGNTSPVDVWMYAVEKKEKEGWDSISIDSWNYLYHAMNGLREDQYLASVLRKRNEIANRTGLSIFTIIHPPKPRPADDGTLRPPTAYDLKGGSEWFNNGKTMISVHRPNYEENRTEIHFNKNKRMNGDGIIELYFDARKNRYYEKNMVGDELWAYEYQKEKANINPFNDTIEAEDDGLPF